jgi:hypothetical protein
MSSPPLLNYASPPRPDPFEVHADPVHFHLGLPPVSNRLFAAMLIPYVVGPLLLIGGLTALTFVLHDGVGGLWAGTVIFAATAVGLVIRLARCRNVERTVGATADFIYFSDARTAGEPATLLRRDLVDVRVRRSPFRPWIWELVAVPPRKLFVVRSDVPLEPVVLLFGLDAAMLERVAADLRRVPKAPTAGGAAAAVSTPRPPAT